MTATDDHAGRLEAEHPEWEWLPHLDPANAGVPEWTYLLHLDKPIGNPDNPRGQAQHYLGSTEDLAARLARHRAGNGARLIEVAVRERGRDFTLVRTWPGGRAIERYLKDGHRGNRLCPDCYPEHCEGRVPEHLLHERDVPAQPGTEPEPDGDEVLLSHAARGREDAARFLSIWHNASADEIEQAAAELQTPYYEGDRTPEGDAQQGAFAEVIIAALKRLRESERALAAPISQAQGVEVSTDTAQDRPPEVETQPTTEWMKGAQTAHDLIVRQVEAGQDAETIAAKWDEALATYDDAIATDAEREWHAGAEETARDMIQTWREMQRAEAEQAQASLDERQLSPEEIAEMNRRSEPGVAFEDAEYDQHGSACGCSHCYIPEREDEREPEWEAEAG